MRSAKRIIEKCLLWVVLSPILLVALLTVSLYIPVVQDWVCQALVAVLNTTSDDLSYEVGQVRLGWPLQLKVKDVTLKQRADDKILLHVGLLQTGLDDIPLQQDCFVLNRLTVADVVVGMDSLTESLGLIGTLQQLNVKRIEVDPELSVVRIREAMIEQPDLLVYVGPSEPDSTEEASPWKVEVGRVTLQQGHVGLDMSDVSLMDALTSISLSSYLDYQHLQLMDVNLEAEDICYRDGYMRGNVNLLRAHEENCGLELEQLGVAFLMEGDHISAQDIDLRLGDADYLRGNAQLDLTLLDSIPQGQADVQLELSLDSANLIRLAAPYLPNLEQQWLDVKTQLVLNAKLNDAELDLQRLDLKVPGMAVVAAEGYGSHIFDNEKRSAALTLQGELTQGDRLLSALAYLPNERDYRLPDSLQLVMEAAQRQHRYSACLDLKQHDCHLATADAAYDLQTEAYQLKADVRGLNVSAFLPGMGYDGISGRIQADGRHFSVPSRHTRLEAEVQIDSLYYPAADGRRDSLRDVSLTASLLGGNYVAHVQADLPNLGLRTYLEGCYLKDTVSAKGYLNVRHADMAHLPYVAPEEGVGVLDFSSKISAAYDWGDQAHLDLRIDSLTYDDQVQHIFFDSIHVALESQPGLTHARVTGGDALLTVRLDQGIAHLPQSVDTLMAELNRQMKDFRPNFEALQQRLPRINMAFSMNRNNPFYQALEMNSGYSFAHAEMSIDNDRWMDVRGMVADLQSTDGSIDFDTLSCTLHPAGIHDRYTYGLHALHVDPRASRTYDVHAGGQLLTDSLTAHLRYVNGKYLTVYDVNTSLAFADDTMTLHLEEGPTLYEQPFAVNPDNYVRLMKYKDMEHVKPETRARVLLQGPKDLRVNLYTRKKPGVEVGNQLLLLVRDLDLAYATRLMEFDGDAAGRYNMLTSVDIFPDSLSAQIRSGVRNFRLGDYRADTLVFEGRSVMAHNRRDVDGTLTVDSIIRLQLDALLADSVNVTAYVSDLPLPLAGTFLPKSMQLRGSASGELSLRGRDMDHAKVNAYVTMQDAGLDYRDLGAHLRFGDDTIRLANNKLRLQNFPIRAANSNPVTLAGTIDMSRDVSNPAINLQVKGENVRIIQSRKLESDDQYIYGTLPITTNIKVVGSLKKMDVTGRLNVLSGTDIHYFMKDDPLATSSRVDQLVEFVSFNEVDRRLSSGKMRRRRVQTNGEEGTDINLKIEVDRAAKVAAHLAGTDNNRVDISGGASLNLECDAEGRIVMSGNYDVRSGKVDYKLPILPMVKTFTLDPSSVLTWQGCDPGNPTIDLTANELVRSTVNDEAGSRVVSFLVSIHISGTLDALGMTFDCTAPDDGTISSEISGMNEEERSKTALMLLIAQTYIGPGNTSSVGLGTANAALSSMLNREMDSMLGNMRHTSIDLGIDTYNTDAGNTRTDYSVKVSQNFFNDRFRATIGGQVSSGGDEGQSAGARLGDMSLEWLIKRDGSHYLKLFRTTNYESVFEGELVETGISYVQERSGYKWNQIFIPTSKKRQQRILELIRQMEAEQADQVDGRQPDQN